MPYGQCSESRRKFNKPRLDAISIPDYVIKKVATHGARHGKIEVKREYHVAWNAWKRCCDKVDSPRRTFYRCSRSISQRSILSWVTARNRMVRTSAKSGMNFGKDHTCELTPEEEDTKDNGILLWTQQAKMKLRSDCRAPVLMKNRLHHDSGEPIEEPIHRGQQRRTQQGQEVFSDDYFSNTRVDRHTGCEYWMPSSSSSRSYTQKFLFGSDLFLLRLVSFTIDSDPL